MPVSSHILNVAVFVGGALLVIVTLLSALSTFVLPRAARSRINRVIFGSWRRLIDIFLYFAKTYRRRDAIMAYYAPLALMSLLPAWYMLVVIGYAGMYWALGVGDPVTVFRLSGSSLFTLGFASVDGPGISALVFSEAMFGLMLVALLIAYLPTMYSAFSRREQSVNLLEVRAGNPPSAPEMLMRFHRNHGLDKLRPLWESWEAWFADVEESHSALPALVYFRSPRAENSWIVAAGTILDTASLTLSCIDIPYETSAALCIRAGFLTLRRIANFFQLPNPQDPHFPADAISIGREEFDDVLNQLTKAGLPIKPDRERAWKDFAGWRVNYDRSLILLCELLMAPPAPWSSDRLGKDFFAMTR